MSEKLRFGLVGAGAIAQAYAQAFGTSDEAELVAVADVAPAAAETMAHAYGCKPFTSYRAMANGAKLDAVIVCTPPVSHADICVYFLQHKTPVLCEKPLSINGVSARAIIDTAKRSGVKFTMASKFRYVEDVIKAKAIVTAGLLGDIILFENAFTSRVDMSGRWNAKPEVSGGGVLIDNGTHSVDLVRYFLGPVAEVQVVEGKRSQGLAVEDTVRIFVRSTAGVLGSIDLSWSINKEHDSYINIYGSQGTLWIGWKESKYRQSGAREWVVFGKGYNKVQAFRSNIDNFARAIRGEEALLISADEALASVDVIEAAYADLKRSHWVAVGAPAPASVEAPSKQAVLSGAVA
jgi:predicted dehydrogenase